MDEGEKTETRKFLGSHTLGLHTATGQSGLDYNLDFLVLGEKCDLRCNLSYIFSIWLLNLDACYYLKFVGIENSIRVCQDKISILYILRVKTRGRNQIKILSIDLSLILFPVKIYVPQRSELFIIYLCIPSISLCLGP